MAHTKYFLVLGTDIRSTLFGHLHYTNAPIFKRSFRYNYTVISVLQKSLLTRIFIIATFTVKIANPSKIMAPTRSGRERNFSSEATTPSTIIRRHITNEATQPRVTNGMSTVGFTNDTPATEVANTLLELGPFQTRVPLPPALPTANIVTNSGEEEASSLSTAQSYLYHEYQVTASANGWCKNITDEKQQVVRLASGKIWKDLKFINKEEILTATGKRSLMCFVTNELGIADQTLDRQIEWWNMYKDIVRKQLDQQRSNVTSAMKYAFIGKIVPYCF